MNPQIQKILQDLYAVEPSLKSQEAEVAKIIEELLVQKPDTKFDEQFARGLRQRLMARAEELKGLNPISKTKFGFFGALGGIAAVVVLAFLIVWPKIFKPTDIIPGPNQEKPSTSGPVVKLEAQDIKPFASKEEFVAFLEQSRQQGQSYFGGIGGGPALMQDRAMAVPQANTKSTGQSSAPSSAPLGLGGGTQAVERVSETNVQVKGIDEPDIVKTDGQNIYYSNPDLYYSYDYPVMEKSVAPGLTPGIMPPQPAPSALTKIIKALPVKDAKIIGQIDKQGEMLLSEKILVVLSSQGDYIYGFDISDPSQPKEQWRLKLEAGYLVASRLQSGKLYLVMQNNINDAEPCPIRPLSLNGQMVEVPCKMIYHPQNPVADATTYSAFMVDPKTGQVNNKISFVGSGAASVAYVSPENLYVTYGFVPDMLKLTSDFLHQQGKGIFPDSTVQKIDKLANLDISFEAKMTEVQTLVQKYLSSLSADDQRKKQNDLNNASTEYLKQHKRELFATGIVKINLNDFNVAASGSVPGSPLNQFALDEYQGNLRMAVTIGGQGMGFIGSWSQAESANDVYVLNSKLETVGQVQDLGQNERIYAVRFIDDRGFVVTFRQTDPFYVLDLQDPKKPAVKGELKIPGYSSYLHPLAKNIILGVGQETGKVKLSLFDVTDAQNPKEIDKYLLDEYWTEAANNHHAFLQDEKYQVFFLPGGQSAYVFSYKNNKLELKKAVSQITAKRALYINDTLFVLGSEKLVALDEKTWDRIVELPLR